MWNAHVAGVSRESAVELLREDFNHKYPKPNGWMLAQFNGAMVDLASQFGKKNPAGLVNVMLNGPENDPSGNGSPSITPPRWTLVVSDANAQPEAAKVKGNMGWQVPQPAPGDKLSHDARRRESRPVQPEGRVDNLPERTQELQNRQYEDERLRDMRDAKDRLPVKPRQPRAKPVVNTPVPDPDANKSTEEIAKDRLDRDNATKRNLE